MYWVPAKNMFFEICLQLQLSKQINNMFMCHSLDLKTKTINHPHGRYVMSWTTRVALPNFSVTLFNAIIVWAY